jgi:hypothetical protein
MDSDGKYLLFVSRPSGYELFERVGEPPEVGAEVELESGLRLRVAKVGSSPLPLDPRPCVFLQS